jgi:hypothetical protein
LAGGEIISYPEMFEAKRVSSQKKWGKGPKGFPGWQKNFRVWIFAQNY